MATGRATKLTGAVGEFVVAAELCRRGLLATPFAGNVPHYDIIASGQSGGQADQRLHNLRPTDPF